MRNTIALCQFELQLAEISSTKNNNELNQEELINALPELFNQYYKGKELAQASIKENPDLDWKSFSKRIQNIQVPKLSEDNSTSVFDEIVEDIDNTIPAAKAELDGIRTIAGGNTGGNIQALPVVPVVFGLIFLVGLANGARDGKKKK